VAKRIVIVARLVNARNTMSARFTSYANAARVPQCE
jgi:hypothetical protein